MGTSDWGVSPRISRVRMSVDDTACGAIGKGTINPVELTEAFLDKIADHPITPRIYARMTPARARGEAMGAAARALAIWRKRASNSSFLFSKRCCSA